MKHSHPWWAINYNTPEFIFESDEDRLQSLNITTEEYRLYHGLFLADRIKWCFHKQDKNGNWPKIGYQWDGSTILKHLCGEQAVAIPFHDRLKSIMLDIDCHGGSTRGSAIEVAKRAIEAIPGEALVYQSSMSGGIRVMWFLDGLCSREKLYRGVTELLRQSSVSVMGGICEVRLGRAPDRLPFGCDSMLLDPMTLDPIFHLTLSESIELVRQHREQHTVRRSIFGEDLYVFNPTHSYSENKLMKVCLEDGLPTDVSTNDCLLGLARHYWYSSERSRDNVKSCLKDWITQKHNGNSTRVNNGELNNICEQIDRIVARLYSRKKMSAVVALKIGLSVSEVRVLINEPFSYRFLAAVFKLLCFAKKKLFLKLDSKGYSCNRPLSINGDSTNKWGRDFTRDCAVTNGAENSCHVHLDLGKNFMRSLRVPNSGNTSVFLNKLESTGLIKLKRKAFEKGHKAAQYWINFPFDLSSPKVFNDFDSAIWNLLGYDGIRRRFSPYYARNLKQEFEGEGFNSKVP